MVPTLEQELVFSLALDSVNGLGRFAPPHVMTYALLCLGPSQLAWSEAWFWPSASAMLTSVTYHRFGTNEQAVVLVSIFIDLVP